MKKERILISTIIPSYNRADTVGQTIESILAQEVDADMEIVIGDDCSTDNAREVLLAYKEKYPDIIQLIFHEQNVGLGANWATCVKACRGKYICNCDNDDYWHNPHKLQIQLDFMESHSESNICVTDYRNLNRVTGEERYRKTIIDPNQDLQYLMYYSCRNISNATFMYRADFMKAHLDLDEFITRRFTLQDWPTWVILTAYTDIDILPESTATVCVETASVSRPNSVERFAQRLEGDKRIVQYLGELFPDKFSYEEKEWNAYANWRLMGLCFDIGDFKSARKYGELCKTYGGFKLLCSQYVVLFHVFRLLKRIKMRIYGKNRKK